MIVLVARIMMLVIAMFFCLMGGGAIIGSYEYENNLASNAKKKRDGYHFISAIAFWTVALAIACSAMTLTDPNKAVVVIGITTMFIGLILWPRKTVLVNSAIAAGLTVAALLFG